MKLISKFCLNLPINIPNNIQILNKELNLKILKMKDLEKDYLYKNKDKKVFDVSRTNLLVYQIFPFFENYKIFSRKSIDFQILSILLKLRYLGYHKNESYKNIMQELAKIMNNARYLNKTDNLYELIDNINNILNNQSIDFNKSIKFIKPLTISINYSIIENYPNK
jgi:hypothetical protein